MKKRLTTEDKLRRIAKKAGCVIDGFASPSGPRMEVRFHPGERGIAEVEAESAEANLKMFLRLSKAVQEVEAE